MGPIGPGGPGGPGRAIVDEPSETQTQALVHLQIHTCCKQICSQGMI